MPLIISAFSAGVGSSLEPRPRAQQQLLDGQEDLMHLLRIDASSLRHTFELPQLASNELRTRVKTKGNQGKITGNRGL